MAISKADGVARKPTKKAVPEDGEQETKGKAKDLLVKGGLLAAATVATGGAGLAVKLGAGAVAKLAPSIAKGAKDAVGKVGDFVSGESTASKTGGTSTSGRALQAAVDNRPKSSET